MLPSKHLFVLKMPSRCLQDMSWRCLQHVFSATIFRLPRRLEDILEDEKLLRWRRLEDVLKTSWRHVLKTSSTRLQRNNFTSSKTFWRRLEDVLQRRFEDVLKTKNCYAEDVFKTSWKHVLKTSWGHLEDIMEINKIFTGDICI